MSAPTIDELEEQMFDWVAGRRSWWNNYASVGDEVNHAQAMCAIADAAEVVKLSAAIQALRAARGVVGATTGGTNE